jgi:hypothetical protein
VDSRSTLWKHEEAWTGSQTLESSKQDDPAHDAHQLERSMKPFE